MAESTEITRLQSLFSRLSAGGPDSETAAIGMIRLLEDPTSLFSQAFNRTRARLSDKQKDLLDDTLAVARARIDPKASIEYWMRDRQGKPIRLTTLQKFYIDFFTLGQKHGLVPIIFSSMGTGKTMILLGLIAYEVGRDVNICEQLICATDPLAIDRGLSLRQLLESPHYQKVFPNVKKDTNKWAAHKMLVQRTQASGEIRSDSIGDAGGVDATIFCSGAFSGGLGSRSICSNFDDLATEANAIFEPEEGERLYRLLLGTWFTRKTLPFGMTDEEYRTEDDPWKARVIGTPWASTDAVYRLRNWEGAAVALIGVNASVTAFNVQAWGVTAEQMEPLRKQYGKGTVKFGTLSPEMKTWCESQAIPTEEYYTLSPGQISDKLETPTMTMELPFAATIEDQTRPHTVPRLWYLNELKKVSKTDPKRYFWRPYGCQVYDVGDLAYPSFAKSCFTHYPQYHHSACDGENHNQCRPMIVQKLPINKTRGEIGNMTIGWRAYLVDPPQDSSYKIVTIDLSGMQRMGIVFNVAVLTPQYRRRIIEVTRAAFAPEEISDGITELYARHPDLANIFVESVSLQKIYVGEMIKHKEEYPWWHLVAPWEDAAISKNDTQLGILAMGTSFANGGFEIPNTWNMPEHGQLCQCGYCVLISDAVHQPRLTKVSSDLLVTAWGIHRKMPNNIEIPDPEPPTGYSYVKSGYDLMEAPPVLLSENQGSQNQEEIPVGQTDMDRFLLKRQADRARHLAKKEQEAIW